MAVAVERHGCRRIERNGGGSRMVSGGDIRRTKKPLSQRVGRRFKLKERGLYGLFKPSPRSGDYFLAVSQEVQVAHSFLALLASHVLQLEQEARVRAAAARARVRKRFIQGRNGWLVR